MTTDENTPGLARMTPTTVRLSDDLRALLEVEAARTGVSLSQFMREAALARAAFAAGARAGVPGELLGAWADPLLGGKRKRTERAADTQRLMAVLARAESRERRAESVAVRAESRQARRQARVVREGTTPKD